MIPTPFIDLLLILEIFYHPLNLALLKHLTLFLPDCINPGTDIQYSRPMCRHNAGSWISICHDIFQYLSLCRHIKC